MDKFQLTIEMFDQCRAALDPVTIIAVSYPVYFAYFGVMDMTADNTVYISIPCNIREGIFKIRDKFDGILYLQLQIGGQGPVGISEPRPDGIQEII